MLTERQSQVAKLLQTGFSPVEIATKLNISTKTVKYHLTDIYCKAGVKSKYEYLIKYKKPIKETAITLVAGEHYETLLSADFSSFQFALFSLAMKLHGFKIGQHLTHRNLVDLATTLMLPLLVVRRMAWKYNEGKIESKRYRPTAPPTPPPPSPGLSVGVRRVIS